MENIRVGRKINYIFDCFWEIKIINRNNLTFNPFRYRNLLFILFTILGFQIFAQEIKVMSYNIRLDVKSDGENWWENRKNRVSDLMNYYEADFIGCQEVLFHQLHFLQSELNTYEYIGVGRDDGKTAGEFSCIFYQKNKYKLLHQETFWLSPTPDSVSFGWGAACRRVCTYGLFQLKSNNKKVLVFNTHLDHISEQARQESVKLIAEKANQISQKHHYPIIIMGDFNSKLDEIPAKWMSEKFYNTRTVCESKPYGDSDTWNGFQFDKKPQGCIDYVFVSKDDKWSIKKFATITDSYQMKYPSDHFPILATLYYK